MNREQFIKYIKSLGFKYNVDYMVYENKRYTIYVNNEFYSFLNEPWVYYRYNNLTPFNKYFKQELRSIKFKKILG